MMTATLFLLALLDLPDTKLMRRNAPALAVGIHVTDEDGKAVEGAEVRFGFAGFYHDDYVTFRKSDANGNCMAKGCSYLPVRVTVTKDGFYRSETKVVTIRKEKGREYFEDTFETITIRPIGRPCSLIARRKLWLKLPSLGEFLGYDFWGGDWLPPHGSGRIADFLIKVEGVWKSERDYHSTLTVRMAGPHDGFREFQTHAQSDFGSPRMAEGEFTKREIIHEEFIGQLDGLPSRVRSEDPKANYLFRIRTEVDDQGEIVRAHYGKIYGDIRFFGWKSKSSPPAALLEYCYLNPRPNDRNLEFDPQRNLDERDEVEKP